MSWYVFLFGFDIDKPTNCWPFRLLPIWPGSFYGPVYASLHKHSIAVLTNDMLPRLYMLMLM